MIEVYQGSDRDGGCMACAGGFRPVYVIRLATTHGAMAWETRVCKPCAEELAAKIRRA